MAKNLQATRRWLAASGALIFTAMAMLYANADAQSGFDRNRHAYGGALQGLPLQPVVAGPAGGREVFAHTPPFQLSWNEHGIGSHVATLGFDGVWVDTYRYAPTAPAEHQPTRYNALAHSRAPSIKTPDPVRGGIILVRGDRKSYVLFP